MQKHRIIRFLVVGMVALLAGLVTLPNLGSEGASSDKQAPASAETTAKPAAETQDPIAALKQQMALQKKQIEQLQKALAEQEKLLEEALRAKPSAAPDQAANLPAAAAQAANPPAAVAQPAIAEPSNLGQVASTTPMIPKGLTKPENASAPIVPVTLSARAAAPAQGAGGESSPLQLHIGDATITPVAFMDLTSVYRNHDTNGNIGTNFGNIPFVSGTAYAPNLSEFRLSSENSRIGFRVDADVKGAHVIGYMEADFHGNNAANVAVATDSNTMRERLYWVDLNTGHFEVLGGQTWSLITPGRKGISPLPGDIFYSQDIDLNYQAGLVFGRIPELRFVYHPSKQVAFAVALDSPDQYAGGNGGSGSITLPSALNGTSGYAPYQAELDYGSGNTLSTPNPAPDIIAKLAFDPNKMVHFEIGGVERDFRVFYPGTAGTPASGSTPAVPGIPSTTFSAEGGGGFVNLAVEPIKGLRLLTNSYFSDGGGRYIYGEAPDLIAHADGSISLVHSGSTVTGFEFTTKKTMLYGYYGGIYIERNTAVDTNGKYIGYGYTGSATSQNREIQEITFGFNQTVWKNAKYGALNFMGQYSYLTRAPWYVATGAPADATINMLFFNLRYTLPGSAPTLGK